MRGNYGSGSEEKLGVRKYEKLGKGNLGKCERKLVQRK